MSDHKLVQVNAMFKNQESTSNSKFSIDFLTRDLDKVINVSMIQASLPRMFTNIEYFNNVIDIQHSGADNFYTIPVGQYTITTLVTALNTATAPIFVTWAFNSATNKLTATYSSVTTVTLSAANSTIGPYIGLTSDVTLGAPSDLPDFPQLSGPDEVMIQSKLVAVNSMVAAGDQVTIPWVGSIDFSKVPYGFNGNFSQKDIKIGHVDFPYQMCMRKIDIVLTDNYNNVLTLPGNCYLNLVLQFTVASFS